MKYIFQTTNSVTYAGVVITNIQMTKIALYSFKSFLYYPFYIRFSFMSFRALSYMLGHFQIRLSILFLTPVSLLKDGVASQV